MKCCAVLRSCGWMSSTLKRLVVCHGPRLSTWSLPRSFDIHQCSTWSHSWAMGELIGKWWAVHGSNNIPESNPLWNNYILYYAIFFSGSISLYVKCLWPLVDLRWTSSGRSWRKRARSCRPKPKGMSTLGEFASSPVMLCAISDRIACLVCPGNKR